MTAYWCDITKKWTHISISGEATLFAPTNEAIDNVVIDPNDLESILTFHALNAAVQSSDITDELKVASVNTAEVRFNIYNASVSDFKNT